MGNPLTAGQLLSEQWILASGVHPRRMPIPAMDGRVIGMANYYGNPEPEQDMIGEYDM